MAFLPCICQVSLCQDYQIIRVVCVWIGGVSVYGPKISIFMEK